MISHTEIRDSKIVRQIINDTITDKIVWKIFNVDLESGKILYTSFFEITKNKKIVFQLSSNINTIKGNFLRIVLKTESPKQHMQLIRKIDLLETPSLNVLLRLVYNRFINSEEKK